MSAVSNVAAKTAVLAALGLGIGAGLSACTVTENGPDGSTQIEVSMPDVSLPSIGDGSGGGGGDSGGGDSGGGDSGGGDSGGGDAGGGDSGGGDSGSSDSGSGDSGGGDSQSAPSGGQDNGMGPLGFLVIAIGVIAVISLIMSGSRSASDRRDAEYERRRTNGRRLQHTVQNARWAESQASQALTIQDNRQLQAAWSQARSYMPDIESSAAGLAANEDDSDLASATGAMGRAVASLRGAMDNYVQVRNSAGIDDAAAKTAEQGVRQAMSQLDHDLQQVSDYSVARGSR